jgi:hypothetical protein
LFEILLLKRFFATYFLYSKEMPDAVFIRSVETDRLFFNRLYAKSRGHGAGILVYTMRLFILVSGKGWESPICPTRILATRSP